EEVSTRSQPFTTVPCYLENTVLTPLRTEHAHAGGPVHGQRHPHGLPQRQGARLKGPRDPRPPARARARLQYPRRRLRVGRAADREEGAAVAQLDPEDERRASRQGHAWQGGLSLGLSRRGDVGFVVAEMGYVSFLFRGALDKSVGLEGTL